MNRNSPAMGDSECILVRKSGGNEEWNRCCYSGLSGSPPSCAPVDFVVPGLDGLHFVVWGTEEGLVQVGYYENTSNAEENCSAARLGGVRVVLGLPMDSERNKRIRHVQYGGGPHALIVAVTDDTVAVYRLDWMLHELILHQEWLGNGVESVEKYLVCCADRSGGGAVLGVSWTHQLDGILLSDSTSRVQMWELQSTGSLQLLWEVGAEDPQDILSAGVRVNAPCATACSQGESSVSVWWYEKQEVRREKLRHSSRLRHIEWSPGVLRKDVLNDVHDEDDQRHPDLVLEDHPAIMTLDASGTVRVWVEMLVIHGSASACDSYFAMTLVVCSPESGAHASSTLTGQRSADFCTWAKPMDSIMGKSTDSRIKSNVLWLVVGWQGTDEESIGLPRLSLYAVRGLAAVVVSNFTGALSGSSATRGSKKRPQVVLWGDHVWNMATRFRFADCLGDACMSTFSARMTFWDDFPKVSCFAASCDSSSPHDGFDIAGITMMTSLTEGLPSSPTSIHQSLEICDTWKGKGYMHSCRVVATCVSKRFVASLDEQGHLIVWKHGEALQFYCSSDVGPVTCDVSMKLFNSRDHSSELQKESLVLVFGGGDVVVMWIMLSEPMIVPMVREHRDSGRALHHMSMSLSKDRSGDTLSLVFKSDGGGVVLEEYLVTSEDARGVHMELAHRVPMYDDVQGDSIISVREMSKTHCLIAATRSGRILYSAGNSFQAMQGLCMGAKSFSRMDYDDKNRLISLVDESKSSLVMLRIESDEDGCFVSACGEIRSDDSIESCVWMSEEIMPCIAVSFSTGFVSIYSLSNASFDAWRTIGQFQGSRPENPVSLQYCKSCLVAQWDRSIGLVSSTLLESDSTTVQLGRILVKRAGPLPQYHPRFLQCLVYSGEFEAFFKVLDVLATWLENVERDDCCSEEFVFSPKISSTSAESSLNHSNGYELVSKVFPGVKLNDLVCDNCTRLPEVLFNFLEKCDDSRKGQFIATKDTPSQDTGMLDMSAFGMETAAPPASSYSTVPSQDTGMLDMSAFGMETAVPPASSYATVSFQDTGMLDMSAFGMETAVPVVSSEQPGKKVQDSESFKMNPPELISVQKCQEFLFIVNRIIVGPVKKEGRDANESSFANESACELVPGLDVSETELLMATLKKTKTILESIDRDVEASTLVCLLCLAWPSNQTVEFIQNHLETPAKPSERALRPSKSIRNAAGIEWDLNETSIESQDEYQSFQSALKAKLGFGENVSVQSVIWLCLSSMTADFFSTLKQFITSTKKNSKDVSGGLDDFRVQQRTQNATTWEDLRSSGIAFWLRDKSKLAKFLEDTSKNIFRETRDADAVALLYAAVGKISILPGLYRTCNRAKEADFFSRDFSQTHNQQAACKNAFVLLGQHRYSLAATFFILGGKVSDAIDICVRDLGDTQLAIILYKMLGEEHSIDISKILDEVFKEYTSIASIQFLKSWATGDIQAVIDCCLANSTGSESFWLLPLLFSLLNCVVISDSTAISALDSQDVLHSLEKNCINTSSMLYMNGLPSLGLQFDMIAANCFPLRTFNRWKRDASQACAHALMEMPIECIPTVYTEKFFSQRIQDYIDVLEGLQASGIKVSSNVVLHTIGDIYKRLAQHQSILLTETSKSLDSIHLGRSNSIDDQSCHSGISSMKRASLDDSRELARMLAQSQKALAIDDSPDQIVYPKGVEIFCVNGDTTFSVCSCPLLAPDVCGRLVAVSTARNGILEFATHPDVELPGDPLPDNNHAGIESHSAFDRQTPKRESGKHSGMFTRFVSQIFDQTSWMTDPLEDASHIIDGDVGLAVASAISSASSKNLDVSNAPALAGAKTTYSKMLVSHPYRQLFLSGCKDTGRIKLWQFDGPRPLGIFTPVPYNDLKDLKSNPDMFSFSTKFARSKSLTSRMSHWGKAVDMSFSENGERFASIGEGGVVAVWRLSGGLDGHSDIDGAHCSEWWQTCLDQQGRAVAFVGGSSLVVAAAGSSTSGNISLWNITSSESCVGRLNHHKSPINRLKTLPGGWLLAAGDDAGTLSVSDVRMLGSSNKAPVLWTTKACKGTIRAIDTISLNAFGSDSRTQPMALTNLGMECGVVSGGDDGIIRIWKASNGALVQHTTRPHASITPKAHRILSLASGDTSYGITDLTVCDEGIISTGTDGIVRLFPRL